MLFKKTHRSAEHSFTVHCAVGPRWNVLPSPIPGAALAISAMPITGNETVCVRDRRRGLRTKLQYFHTALGVAVTARLLAL